MRSVVGVSAKAFAAVAFAGLAACGSTSDPGDAAQPSNNDGLAAKIIMGNANPVPLTPPVDDQIKRDCPPIEILEGAAGYPVYEKPGESDPFSLRYQATLAQTARECSSLGAEVAIRIGLVGRVILGPKGVPGTYTLPLRIAVVDEKNQPAYSRSHRVSVTIPAGQARADFSHIEDNVTAPIPANRFRGWRILVGYDPKDATPEPRAARRR